MAISKTALEDRINELITVGSLTTTEIAQLSGSYNILNTSVLYDAVSTISLLPAADENTGRWIYVQDIKKILVSNGYGWTNNVETDQSNILKPMLVWGNDTQGTYSQPILGLGGAIWASTVGGEGGIKTDGTFWHWGYNFQGQAGANTAVGLSSPVQEISSSTNWVSGDTARVLHTAGIKSDGTLWLWGANNYGQLGVNNVTCYSSPVQEVSSSTTWSKVTVADAQTAAIKTDGTLWCWGFNSSGQLGTNNTTCYSSPVQEASSSTNWAEVSSGQYFITAIKSDGTLWSWGFNSSGQLGTNNTTCYSSPVQEVSSSTDWASVSCGGSHTVAIKTDGTLWSWGWNFYGQLGTNNTTCYSSPVQEISSSTSWDSVSCGSGHTVAIKTDGTLWSWGFNSSGQLGTNNTTCYSSPVQETTSNTNWTSVGSNSRASTTLGIVNITTGFSEA